MGVHGLWDLLAPVGRRVSVETLAGKRLAIDASIWMIQFMKAMRDEKGEMVKNAHVLGFFRRICKLLFLRTKPVFVFDGGTPALKRRTVIARRRQRENAQAKIRKTAEKLLLNNVKAMRLKQLAENFEDRRDKNNSKGKEVILDKSDTETNDAVLEGCSQKMVDEMLAASVLAEECGELDSAASTSTGMIGGSSGSISACASEFPTEDEDDEDDEEMILPITGGNVDPAVLAALPPSMQLDLLVQMRERLMAENRQKYQRVKKAPQKFSELQIEAYLKTVAFRREIDEVQRAAAGKGVDGVQTSRIASEANREFIFSSSFSGDKQVLASGRADKNPEKQERIEKKNSSLAILNAMASATKSNAEAGLPSDAVIQTFLDERGCTRVSRRAMGIHMTRDLQRNINLMKELEQERTTTNHEANTPINLNDREDHSGKSQCGGQFFEAVDDFSCDLVQNSSVNSLLEAENHKDTLKSGTCIKITFDDDEKHRALDGDDEFFAHLVSGNLVKICSADNSASDCEWEDGITGMETGSLTNGSEFETNSSHGVDGNKNEFDVEWEEGSLFADNKLELESFDIEDSKDNEVGGEWQEVTTGIHKGIPSTSADGHKALSKGSAEEAAALQEAIRRSLEDLTGGRTSSERHDLKESDYTRSRQRQWESCSPKLRSQLRRVLDDNEPSESLVDESDQSCDVAGEYVYAPSSPGTHLRSAAFVSAVARVGPVTPIDGLKNDNAATIRNSSKVSKTTIGQAASVMDEVTSHTDLQKKTVEDDTCLISVQERGLDAEISASRNKDNATELSGASLEDELLVLDQEYRSLGEEQRKLERNADSVKAEMFVECQELLQMFGLPYIIAPMEAEAQCAYMELANLVDGVVTDDSDVFLFGARSVYKNIFDDRKYVETYFMKDIESELGLNREKLIRMALLLGSDYTEGVSGIGIVNAIEVVNAFPEEDGLHKFREWIESPDPTILGEVGVQARLSSKKKGSKASKNGISNSKSDSERISTSDFNALQENENKEAMDIIQNTKQIFMNKHRNVSKNWHIPTSFPSDAVISAYTAPQVDESTEPFAWGKPDVLALRRLCWEKFGWASQKADELLLPVLKEYNKHETQLRLEAFYSFNERFAKIRSKRIKQAVKGITGKRSLELTNTDDLPEVPENVKKGETSANDKKSKREKSLPQTKEFIVGETKNTTKNSMSLQKQRNQKEGLLSGRGRIGLTTDTEGRRLNAVGSSRLSGRHREKAVKRGRRKENADSEQDKASTHKYTSSNDEHEVLAEKVQLPNSVRRSKRARKATCYVEQDEESDELTDSLNSSDQKHIDDEAGEQKSSKFERGVADVCREREQTSEDPFPLGDLSGDYLLKGGGFCVDEDGAETENKGSIKSDGAAVDADGKYLQMGGGFCTYDKDQDFQECDGGGAYIITGDISTTSDEVGQLIDRHEVVTSPANVLDTVQGLQKRPFSDTKLNPNQNEIIDGNPSNVAETIKDDAPTSLNPFSAVPYLKRRRQT